MQVAVVLQCQALDDREPCRRTIGLGDLARPAELDDGEAGQAGELAAEGRNL
jgi:hypothetical protein